MLSVDPRSPTPPYEQLRVQLLAQMSSGELPHGSRLPTVRRLAEDLGLAANTVARTYRELEASGAVETRGRNGTVVAWSSDDAEREVEQAAEAFAERVRALGFDAQRAITLIGSALAR